MIKRYFSKLRDMGYKQYFKPVSIAILLAYLIILLDVSASTGFPVNSDGDSVELGSTAIYGHNIVWSDNRSGVNQINIKDLNSSAVEKQLSPSASSQISPAINRDIVVWQENGDLYYRDLSNEDRVQLTDNGFTNPKTRPAIYNNRVVWEEFQSGRYQIYSKLLTESGNGSVLYSDLDSNQNHPVIYRDYVVWVNDSVNIETLDLKLINVKSGVVNDLSTASGDQIEPAISGNIITWTDTRDGLSQIYSYDLLDGLPPVDPASAGIRLSPSTSDQSHPSISGNRIVWEDYQNGIDNPDILMKDVSTNTVTPITADPFYQQSPFIHGDKVMWENRQELSAQGSVRFLKTAKVTLYSSGFETEQMSDPPSGWAIDDMNVSDGLVYWSEVSDWALPPNTPRAHTGTRSAWVAGHGGGSNQYENNMDARAERTFDLSGYTNASLSFWYYTPSIAPGDELSDICWVEISVEGTAVVDQYMLTSGPTAGWIKKDIDLTLYAGQVIKVRWHWISSDTDTAEGTYIDDIDVTAETVWPLERIQISPDSVSIPASGSQIFTAQGLDAYDGAVWIPSFAWSTDAVEGGINPASGLSSTLTAGTTPGLTYKVTAAYGGISGSSNITTTAGPVDHFTISSISTPKMTNRLFRITVTAKDAYNNIVEDYAENISLTDLTGTITPSTIGPFTDGSWTGDVFITTVINEDFITAITIPPDKTGVSNAFGVIGETHHAIDPHASKCMSCHISHRQ